MKETLLPIKILSSQGFEKVETLFEDKGKLAIVTYHGESGKYFAKAYGEGSYIILDFGMEMHGGVRIIAEWVGNSSCKVRIRFGESYGEVNSSIGEKNATNNHSPRDFEALIVAYSDITFGQTGFRFVRIDLLEDGKNIFLKNIYAENNILSAPLIYSYEGKDERIKQIFNTAKRTVDLCSSTTEVWDGIKRDRLLWIGDLGPEMMAINTLYGRQPIIERSLDIAKKIAPLPLFMNNITTYSMWWLIMVHDFYKEFNDKEFLLSHIDYVKGLIDLFNDLIDETGTFSKEFRTLVDWPTLGTVDEDVGSRCVLMMALNAASNIYNDLGLDLSIINEVKRKVTIKSLEVKKMKQIIALKYAAFGEISDEEYNILIEGGAKGFSTYMSYYILKAIAARDEALAIKLMKDYYGAMLDIGATTFFEDFNIEWLEGSGRIDEPTPEGLKDIHGDFGAHCYIGFRHSLCHGWSAGVIKFIKEHCK